MKANGGQITHTGNQSSSFASSSHPSVPLSLPPPPASTSKSHSSHLVQDLMYVRAQAQCCCSSVPVVRRPSLTRSSTSQMVRLSPHSSPSAGASSYPSRVTNNPGDETTRERRERERREREKKMHLSVIAIIYDMITRCLDGSLDLIGWFTNCWPLR